MSLRLHPEFGLNPSLDHCFFCGEAIGVALLGNNRGEKAPPEIVSSYKPCKKCKAQMDEGIVMIEVRQAKPGEAEIVPNMVPTGKWVVITEASVRKVFEAAKAEEVVKARKAIVEEGLFKTLGIE